MKTNYSLYKCVWSWKDDILTYYSLEDGKNKVPKQQTPSQDKKTRTDKGIYFLENVDQNQQKFYKLKYQRTLKTNTPNVITMEDIKNVVIYLLVGDIPKNILKLFYSQDISAFCRTLVLYFQLYLLVWNDLLYRRNAYASQMLKHPTSIVRETLCRTYLSKLRSRIGREYALIIAGQGKYIKVHHMNNPINRSYITKDIKLYDYLFTFCARVVWVALGRSNYKEIETEISRLFHYKQPVEKSNNLTKTSSKRLLVDDDNMVLRGNNAQTSSCWNMKSPVINEVFRNDNGSEEYLKWPQFGANTISGLGVALSFPEELLAQFGIVVGILGQSRDSFEPLLHVKQESTETTFDQEMEAVLGNEEVLPEKPWLKMYEFIHQLKSSIDLTLTSPSFTHNNISEEIKFYLDNHTEDGKKSYQMLKKIKSPY